MKKIITLFAMISLAIACNQPQSLVDRMELLADDAAQRAEEYTEDDWNWSVTEFEDIISLYETEMYSFSEDEKNQFGKALGRYSGIVAKYGLEQFGEYANELGGYLNQLDSFIDAFDEGFEDTFEGVEDTLDEIFEKF